MSRDPYTLEDILCPRSVAILGASRASHKWGHVAAKQLIAGGFPGNIYLINPSVPDVLGRLPTPVCAMFLHRLIWQLLLLHLAWCPNQLKTVLLTESKV